MMHSKNTKIILLCGDTLDNENDLVAGNSTCLISTATRDEVKINLENVIEISRFSSFTKLLRVTALVLKFISKLKKKVFDDKDLFSVADMHNAKVLWVKEVQKFIIRDTKFKELKKKLDLYFDDKDLLRCGGRLEAAEVPVDTKHPILLSRDHYFSKLVIMDYH